ncbi:DUF1657 domain-containing protein [Bacillus benzoevorans]|uniref:DUF1657 domain-containing protein n=1 Tax=Bacillus benzoevorans TaxID=1456 RepID=A0A7X0LUW5_9BACI|nr:DUF1657 domain-containing protein [Bacillus benzoevorans]MBB6444973.1 hypothetical protein [Bacillus benzoevorans]
MTIFSNVKQTLATVKSIEAQLSALALNSLDPSAQETFHNMMLLMEEVKQDLYKRTMEMQLEEPQYKPS